MIRKCFNCGIRCDTFAMYDNSKCCKNYHPKISQSKLATLLHMHNKSISRMADAKVIEKTNKQGYSLIIINVDDGKLYYIKRLKTTEEHNND